MILSKNYEKYQDMAKLEKGWLFETVYIAANTNKFVINIFKGSAVIQAVLVKT